MMQLTCTQTGLGEVSVNLVLNILTDVDLVFIKRGLCDRFHGIAALNRCSGCRLADGSRLGLCRGQHGGQGDPCEPQVAHHHATVRLKPSFEMGVSFSQIASPECRSVKASWKL